MSEDKKSKPGLWALLVKLGSKCIGVVTKLLKLSKVGLAAASFAGYAVLFSWKFALLLMIAVGFHESGHVWAMKRMGIKTKGFYFLPFVGGAAIAEENYKTYGQNAFIAIMGPIWGMLLALAAGVVYWTTGEPLWAAAGAWMATLNLFNLLPVTPLDGGQLVRSIAFSIHKNVGLVFLVLSLILAGVILFYLHVGLFVILLAVGALELGLEIWQRVKIARVKRGELPKWKLPSSMLLPDGSIKEHNYPDSMNWQKIALTALVYAGTIAGLLAILFSLKHEPGADLAVEFFE